MVVVGVEEEGKAIVSLSFSKLTRSVYWASSLSASVLSSFVSGIFRKWSEGRC